MTIGHRALAVHRSPRVRPEWARRIARMHRPSAPQDYYHTYDDNDGGDDASPNAATITDAHRGGASASPRGGDAGRHTPATTGARKGGKKTTSGSASALAKHIARTPRERSIVGVGVKTHPHTMMRYPARPPSRTAASAVPFDFSTPSPDDVVLASRSKSGEALKPTQ